MHKILDLLLYCEKLNKWTELNWIYIKTVFVFTSIIIHYYWSSFKYLLTFQQNDSHRSVSVLRHQIICQFHFLHNLATFFYSIEVYDFDSLYISQCQRDNPHFHPCRRAGSDFKHFWFSEKAQWPLLEVRGPPREARGPLNWSLIFSRVSHTIFLCTSQSGHPTCLCTWNN